MVRLLLRFLHSGRTPYRGCDAFFTPPAFAALARLTRFTGAKPPTSDEAFAIIAAAEEELSSTDSAEVRLELGYAISAVVASYVHGEERLRWLPRAKHHLEIGITLAKDSPCEAVLHELHAALARLRVEEPVVQDLTTMENGLWRSWSTTTHYRPEFCTLADALYQQGRFREAAEVAIALHRRAKKDPDWELRVPHLPLALAAKALRAEIRRLQRAQRIDEARGIAWRLVGLASATQSDRKLLRRFVAPKLPMPFSARA